MEKRLKFALQILRICCPHFTHLLSVCDIRFDSRIKTAGIFPSGIVVLSSEYCGTLSVPGIAYVIITSSTGLTRSIKITRELVKKF